ncbi:MAG: hypothetical protein IVW53_14160 [Chloroflexi bacterium]|nr:hypothetical protein [Chloroflexota bacterium]
MDLAVQPPAGSRSRLVEIALRERWHVVQGDRWELAEYAYELRHDGLDYRRALHRHDVDHFVRTYGVATHEHCEATTGNPACGHYMANPCRGALDGFDRLYDLWLTGTKPDCSQLRCSPVTRNRQRWRYAARWKEEPTAVLQARPTPRALRVAVGPEVEGVEVDHVDPVRREGPRDLCPMLGRVVDRLAEDRRSRPEDRPAVWVICRPVRHGALSADPGVVSGAAGGKLGDLGDRRRWHGPRRAWGSLEARGVARGRHHDVIEDHRDRPLVPGRRERERRVRQVGEPGEERGVRPCHVAEQPVEGRVGGRVAHHRVGASVTLRRDGEYALANLRAQRVATAMERAMTRANLTLQLDMEVIRRARIVAAKRGTSISALAATQLMELVDEDERVELARGRAEAILKKPLPRGGRSWTRDELHDRQALRSR